MEEIQKFTIREWSLDDRPREKLISKGREALSNSELLAIILSSGSREESAVDLAKRVLNSVGNDLGELSKKSVKEMCQQYKGIGQAKAVSIAAAFELGNRRLTAAVSAKPYLNCSRKIYEYVYPFMTDLDHEECWALYLNSANHLIGKKCIGVGGVNETTVDPRVVLKHAVQLLATSIVLCHNHPSGNTQPSDADNRLTSKMKQASITMNLILLDHLVFGNGSYYSYSDHGLL